MGKRIIISTVGSLGDLHSYLAIAWELKARGHQAAIATNELYRRKVEAEGVEFIPARPHFSMDQEQDRKLMQQAMDIKHGTEFVIRQLLLPTLTDTYEDLAIAVQGADLLLTHPLIFAGPLVVAKTGVKWASTVLAPLSFLSAYDPSVLPTLPYLTILRFLGPQANQALLYLGKANTGISC